MRRKKINYKIAMYDGNKSVTGYAIELPPPLQNFRCCLRRKNNHAWTCDHYDSGYSVCYAGKTLGIAGQFVANYLVFKAANGMLVKGISTAGFIELAGIIKRDIDEFHKKERGNDGCTPNIYRSPHGRTEIQD